MKIIFIITVTFFIPNFAFAYIDPGGIGAIFNLIIASLVASLFYVRSSIYSFFNNLKGLKRDIANLYKFFKKKKLIVVYCENYQYLKYYGKLIESLSSKELDISLLIDQPNNKLDSLNQISKFYIKSNFLRNLSLNLLRCEILILTTPDIGNTYVKKSKFCKHYFYIFHSAVSTQMIYNEFAFKNYNAICCNGEYQIKELSQEENNFNLPKKNLLKTGYPLFDLLATEDAKKYEKGKILIAPSWDPKIPNLYQKYYSKIIDDLLKNDFEIIFRPHPEYFKRFLKQYDDFSNKYISNSKIKFDTKKSLQEIFKTCETIITDWSGIAFEFVYHCNRKVIFNNVPLKKLNKSLSSPEEMFEYKYRSNVGLIFDPEGDILETINKLRELNFDKKEINNFFEQKFYNLGHSSDFIATSIVNILENLKSK